MDMPERVISRSSRLIGVELEFDAGSTTFHAPERPPEGWSRHHDGSITNGWEYVLDPPVPLNQAHYLFASFCAAFDKTNLCKNGGFHVHVQAHDLTIPDAVKLCNLYRHFQPAINKLVAESRVSNRYCQAFETPMTVSSIKSKFQLDSPVQSRSASKTNRYWVVNPCYMRVSNPQERSVEFRQGSPSKRFPCVSGWAAFCASLVEIVKTPGMPDFPSGQDIESLIQYLQRFEELSGWENLAAWVGWREHYLNRPITEDDVAKLSDVFDTDVPHGVFHVSRRLDINLAVAQRLILEGLRRGILVASNDDRKWLLALSEDHVQRDIEMLKQALQKRKATAVEMVAPTTPQLVSRA